VNHEKYPELKDRVALVTGSSKALGAETAPQFALSGAKVVVHGRDQQAIARVVSSIRSEIRGSLSWKREPSKD
jgi:NAD(P)-dependent dehydrogenase (short-subunit alcohol dehydrogenase family)